MHLVYGKNNKKEPAASLLGGRTGLCMIRYDGKAYHISK